jgi:hypothetical protein
VGFTVKPVPVPVVDAPPGADEMPAEPVFGEPTGGFVPTPGALPIAAPAPAPCAKAAAVVPIRDTAMSAERCSLCRITDLQFDRLDTNAGGIAPFPKAPRERDHNGVSRRDNWALAESGSRRQHRETITLPGLA